MKRRLIAAVSFLLGGIVILTWCLQENQGGHFIHSGIENIISAVLLSVFWGSTFILFPRSWRRERRK